MTTRAAYRRKLDAAVKAPAMEAYLAHRRKMAKLKDVLRTIHKKQGSGRRRRRQRGGLFLKGRTLNILRGRGLTQRGYGRRRRRRVRRHRGRGVLSSRRHDYRYS